MPMPRMVDECATCATGCALAGVPGAGVGSSRLVSEKKSTETFFAGPKPEPGLDHLHPHHRHNPVAQWRQRSDETGDGRIPLQYAYVQVAQYFALSVVTNAESKQKGRIPLQ
jgi:hypothetical protein